MDEQFLKDLGFETCAEFYRMVANVDLSSSENVEAFKRWQENDGSKDGLARLPHSADGGV